jgi:hypothetical protein
VRACSGRRSRRSTPACPSRIERTSRAVEGADVDLAVPRSDAAADHVAAALDSELARHLRIVGPEQLAGRGVVGLDQAPRGRHVHDAVDDQRRRLLSTIGVEVGKPGKAELLRIVRRDLCQRAEALLAVGCARSSASSRHRGRRFHASASTLAGASAAHACPDTDYTKKECGRGDGRHAPASPVAIEEPVSRSRSSTRAPHCGVAFTSDSAATCLSIIKSPSSQLASTIVVTRVLVGLQ